MKKTAVALALLASPSVMAGALPVGEAGLGYTYYTFGYESVTYEENMSGATSKVTAFNPVINTGSFTVVTDKLDFSIDMYATYSPNSEDEEWYQNGELVQTNNYQYIKAATNVLVHYKFTPQWRALVGGTMSYQTYKRYGNSNENDYFYGTWEESSSDVYLDMGVGFESAPLKHKKKWHYNFRGVFGVPVISNTLNTAVPEAEFDDGGYRFNVEAGLHHQIKGSFYGGLYVMAGYEKRKFTGPETLENGDLAWLPEADTMTVSMGAKFLWGS